MSGCKHSIWKILSAGVVMFLVVPRLALGEFGICPPYSKTFGPDDPIEEIQAFVAEANARPGGGTLVLKPGEYDFEAVLQITGTVCVRAESSEEGVTVGGHAVVLSGGTLTLSRIGLRGEANVETGGLFFADQLGLTGTGGDWWGQGPGDFHNHGTAYVRNSSWNVFFSNGGVFIMEEGSVHGGRVGYYDQVHFFSNSGFASLSGVSTAGIRNTGTLVVSKSHIDYWEECWREGGDPPGCWEFYPAIDNVGTAEVAESQVDSCEGPVTDLGHNEFYAHGGCIVTDPTSTYYYYEWDAREVVVRTLPYWKEPGKIDVSTETALFVTVMSGGPVDPTTIDFDTFDIEGFPRSALRGVAYYDKNGDGMADYTVWYRLDRDLRLDCGYYDNAFSAMTTDGLSLTGRLRFEAVGCTP